MTGLFLVNEHYFGAQSPVAMTKRSFSQSVNQSVSHSACLNVGLSVCLSSWIGLLNVYPFIVLIFHARGIKQMANSLGQRLSTWSKAFFRWIWLEVSFPFLVSATSLVDVPFVTFMIASIKVTGNLCICSTTRNTLWSTLS